MTPSTTYPQPLRVAQPALALSPGARLLIATGLLVAAAAFRALRLELGGLFVPLHVIPILIALPTVVVPSFNRFPKDVLWALLVFIALFGLSMLPYESSFGDLAKMTMSFVTILAVALMVRRREHFHYGTVALCVSLLVINANGIRAGFVDYVGYTPLADLANKNAYSIYALPIVLLGGFSLLHFRSRLWPRLLIVGAIVSSVFVLFTGANRSGWAGMVLIAVLLALQARRWRALALIGALGVVSYGALTWLGTDATFEHRLAQTTVGYSSDELRMEMLTTAVEVASENPLLGIGPQQLPYELAKRLGSNEPALDPHNVIGYIAGGSGFPALLALGVVALRLWRRPRVKRSPLVWAANDLIRMVIVLFIFRGFFSREVFFVGPVPIALGLALGYQLACIDEQRA